MVTQELEQLLALQRLDLALDDIASREESARARLKTEKEQLEQFKAQAANEKKHLDDTLKEHRMLDLDLKKYEEQVKKYQTQIYEVKTNKEYTALKEQIDKGKTESQQLEDKILQLMMKEDELKGLGGRRNTELTEMDKRLKETEGEVSNQQAQLAREREAFLTQRNEQSAKLTPDLLSRYAYIRKYHRGSSLAHIIELPGGGEGVCSECHMIIRPQVIVVVAKQEELAFCESCFRILYLDIQPSAVSQQQG